MHGEGRAVLVLADHGDLKISTGVIECVEQLSISQTIEAVAHAPQWIRIRNGDYFWTEVVDTEADRTVLLGHENHGNRQLTS